MQNLVSVPATVPLTYALKPHITFLYKSNKPFLVALEFSYMREETLERPYCWKSVLVSANKNDDADDVHTTNI